MLLLTAACGSSPKTTSQPSTAAPTKSIPPSLVGHVVSRIPTSRRVVALTFDAGANGDGVDWQETSGGRSVDSVVQRVLGAATPGEIVLMHVGSNPTDHSTLDADALPRVISGLRAAGYSFVTLDALGAG